MSYLYVPVTFGLAIILLGVHLICRSKPDEWVDGKKTFGLGFLIAGTVFLLSYFWK